MNVNSGDMWTATTCVATGRGTPRGETERGRYEISQQHIQIELDSYRPFHFFPWKVKASMAGKNS